MGCFCFLDFVHVSCLLTLCLVIEKKGENIINFGLTGTFCFGYYYSSFDIVIFLGSVWLKF